MLTAVFAAYPLALLVALLTVGTLSDHLGRRAVVLASLGAQIVAMCVFFVAPSAPVLIAARALQGAATGAATAAFGAALVDLHPRRGTFVNSIAPMAGMAIGALGSSLIATYTAAPTDAVFIILFIVFCVLMACAFFLSETHERRPGAWASLAIRLRVPEAVRPALWAAPPVLVAVWAIGGFVLSLGPNLAEDLMGTSTALPGGFFVFALTGTGMAAVLWHRRHRAATAFISGSIALALGVGAVMTATGT